jgi:hypothetical protein
VSFGFALLMLVLVPFAVRAQNQTKPGPERQVTFAQITDAHIFDEGWEEPGSEPFHHALDDRTALHWSVDEINRLYVAAEPEDRISFIVYTGDFGLQNIFFRQSSRISETSGVSQNRNCSVIAFKTQPGLPPISSELAEEELVAELNRLAVRKVYIVPGNNDLIDEQVTDGPRYECFVDELKAKLLVLPQPVYLESLTAGTAVNAGSVRLAGLNTASFKNASNYVAACSSGPGPVSSPQPAGCPLPQLQSLKNLLADVKQSTPLLLFTHIPDLVDPFRKKPSWEIDAGARSLWEQDACDSRLLGIFAGHFHSADRNLYATNAGTASLALKKCVAEKTWVAPPLAVKFQTKERAPARGFVVVTIRDGGSGAVKVEPDWYPNVASSPLEHTMNLKYFSVIIGVILFAGTLGGWMNYLASREQTEKDDKTGAEGMARNKLTSLRWLGLYRSLLLGIGAAFLVPLFLNMISSTLVENIHSPEKGYDYPKILVFLGFCLVAAISSTAFIKTISERVIKLAEEAKETGREAKEEALQAKRQASETQSQLEPILQSLAEPDRVAAMSATATAVQLTAAERRVLRALVNPEYRLRTAAGIVAETEMVMEDVTRILNDLKARDLADSTTVITRGEAREGFRWFITAEGRKALSQSPE